MHPIRAWFPLIIILLWLPSTASAQARVVASILPVHALVAAVMDGVAEPELLIRGSASPHDYALRPSDVRALNDADVVFWIGPALEAFLERPLANSSATSVPLMETPGLSLLPIREGGLWETDDHGHDHGHHGDFDAHLWLDPRRGTLLAERIAAVLSELDPANQIRYQRNTSLLQERLTLLEGELEDLLAPVKSLPYIVFHDAYQYFERRFGTTAVGSITLNPERSPGARRISEIRARITDGGVRCVFREPQFEPALVNILLEGTDARGGVLDPLGAELTRGPETYPALLRNLAESLQDCLSGR